MVRHTGGKVGRAGRILSSKNTSKASKSKAGKTLQKHKSQKH